MKADITRSTYRKNKNYFKVNAQQGRVQVDANWNEQIDIQEHLNQTFLQDIIGKTGTPIEDPGFEIIEDAKSYKIGKGRYYVDGILCENSETVGAKSQEDLPDNSDNPNLKSPLNTYSATPNQGYGLYVIYLDVWQRHITFLEDPDLLEVALGGADTTTRTKTVWQAKAWLVTDKPELLKKAVKSNSKTKTSKIPVPKALDKTQRALALKNFWAWVGSQLSKGTLQVQITPPKDDDRCSPSPESGYSGYENRLYRVEIHPNANQNAKSKFQFKWSRENASVAAKITNIKVGPKVEEKEMLITIQNNGKDDRARLGEGQWVEVTDDYHELWTLPGRIVQITKIDEKTLENKSTLHVKDVGLNSSDNESLLNFNPPDPEAKEAYVPKNPKVRRWNIPDDKWSIFGYSNDPTKTKLPEQKPIYTASTTSFLPLEESIEIKFSSDNYVPGDYWFIPARTITKSIEWPVDVGANGKMTPKALPSEMQHQYCPLALVSISEAGLKVIYDYRDFFASLTSQLGIYYVSGDGQEIQQNAQKKMVPFELKVGVAIGGVPLKSLPASKWNHWKPRVRFTVEDSSGVLAETKEGDVNDTFTGDPDTEGVVKCFWTLDDENILQHVRAQLVDQNGDAFGLPLFFNGQLPLSFYYMSGDGQEITPNNVFFYRTSTMEELNNETGTTKEEVTPITLKVGAKMGDSPLESVPPGNFVVKFELVNENNDSVGSLCGVDNAFEDQTSVVSSVDVDLKNGVAVCNWAFSPPTELTFENQVSPGKQQVKATLMMKPTGPAGNYVNIPTQLPPVYFNAIFPYLAQNTSANSGILRINLSPDILEDSVIVTPPIKHNLANIKVPPAIILAVINVEGDSAPATIKEVQFMEDYGLYDFGKAAMRFKAVKCNLSTFEVQIELPKESNQTANSTTPSARAPVLLVLRWWAVPARTREDYDQDVALTSCGIKATETDSQGLTIDGWVSPPPPEDKVFSKLIVTIIQPNNETGRRITASDTNGFFSTKFKSNQKGKFNLKLEFDGEIINNVTYTNCSCAGTVRARASRELPVTY